MKEKIRQYAKSIGFDVAGFTDAGILDVAGVLKDRERKGYLSGLEKGDAEERTDPSAMLPGARSIISLGIYYGGSKRKDSGGGKIARAGMGRDYHAVMGNMLGELKEFLQKEYGARSVALTDNNPMVEREIARRAGIGFYGKNCSIINPYMGSFIFLGELITDMYIRPDMPLEAGCGDCDRCMRACPAVAIVEPYEINAKKCLSYITVTKGFLPDDMKRRLQNRIYGCDTCQEACPYNRAGSGPNPAFDMDMSYDTEDIGFILTMNNREFKDSFCMTSAGWRGKTVIQRNALIAAGNMRAEGLANTVERLLSDPRPVIRGTAAWALSRILGKKSLGLLEETYRVERDESARLEISRAISGSKDKI